MPETWTDRDLPVLRAIVCIYEDTGRPSIKVAAIQEVVGLDRATVTKAVQALDTEPSYFSNVKTAHSGHIIAVGKPTQLALRTAGQWPSPEGMLERLVAALDEAGDDDDRPEEERSKFKVAAGTAERVDRDPRR